MNCTTCRSPLSAARLESKPDATLCVPCLEAQGDEAPKRGYMIWDHKTAPYIEIDTELARHRPNAHPRSGRSGQLLSGRYSGVQAEVVEVHNVRASKCHPDHRAVGPSGLCVECAKSWYRRRL